jgi:hypothetical protein
VTSLQASTKIKRDFYFGKLNNQWLYQLRLAKKAIHDSLNIEKATMRSLRRQNHKSCTKASADYTGGLTESRNSSRNPTQQSQQFNRKRHQTFFERLVDGVNSFLCCCSTVRQSTELVMTHESAHEFNGNVLRGVITPMQFESIHTNPTIRS